MGITNPSQQLSIKAVSIAIFGYRYPSYIIDDKLLPNVKKNEKNAALTSFKTGLFFLCIH